MGIMLYCRGIMPFVKIIVGLGNPGKEYEKTRHNVGFMLADLLRENFKFPDWKERKKFSSHISEGTVADEKILLAKPQTFMNLSGEAVQKLVQFYHCPQNDLWVVYDDVDLPLGEIRIRKEGSAGTHKGMKSIIEHLGKTDFPRCRIGIESRGESAPAKQGISSFVLEPFNKEEFTVLQESLKKALRELKNTITC